MTSRWIYRNADREVSSLTFEELARRVAQDEISWTDVVTCPDTNEPVQVEDIIGLRQAVLRAEAAPELNPQSAVAIEPLCDEVEDAGCESAPGSVGGRIGRHRYARWGLGILFLIPVFVVWLTAEQKWRWERFPISADSIESVRPYWFPIIGSVTISEFVFLALDVCVVLVLCAELSRRPR